MTLESAPPTRPELSQGKCEVLDGSRWTEQTRVTVRAVAVPFLSSSATQNGKRNIPPTLALHLPSIANPIFILF